MKPRRVLAALAAAVAAAGALAAEPSTEPVLRIETGMHAATARRVIHEPVKNRLLTTGDDKAVRVWQLPEGRLVNVLRIPIGTGHEGRIFSVSASPDGKTIAVGGWTGWDWDKKGSIYLFDIESGEMLRRISDLPDIVGAIAYSRDGRYLAAGMQASAGIRFFRTADWSIMGSDSQYNDKILGMDFARDGRLVVSSLDGFLRIYDPALKLIGRKRSAPGTKPLAVKFSPDGGQLAVSFHDVTSLAVHSTSDFNLLFTTDAKSITQQTRMADVAWSDDGKVLYGCGDFSGVGKNPIYRWRDGGRGALERIAAANQRLTDLQTLPGGNIAFTAEDPAVGIMDPTGKITLFIGPEIADFRDAAGAFRVSRDGAVVEFPNEAGGNRIARFSLFEKSLSSPGNSGLPPATIIRTAFALAGWKDSMEPTVGGAKLALDDYEVSRSHAITPDDQTLVLGTEWAVRAYGRDARAKWKTEAPGVVWNVAVTADGRSVVATLGDGTLRWYRIEDGVEYLALFPHGAGEEWIAWTPQGYYVSSNYGDNFVGWHLNRGKERSADFFRAVQFERILYRPDIVEEHFRSRGQDAGVAARRGGEQFDIRGLASIAPPRIRVTQMAPATGPDGAARIKLAFAVDRNSLPMQDYAVFLNNIPVTPSKERNLAGRDATSFSREIELDVAGRENLIRIEVANGKSIGLAEKNYSLPGAAVTRARQGDLYVLAVGVNQFVNIKGANLAWAARDADEMEKFFRTQAASNYNRVHSRVISDNTDVKPERAKILEALKFIENAGPRDTVVVFLASHGISDATGAYYFVPRDATDEDVDTVIRGGSKPVTSLVGWSSFFDALRRVAGRRVLIVDTCQAKNIEGRLDLHSLAKRSASSLFSLVVASKGDEESQEYSEQKHGLFTYAFLDGLRGKSDSNADGFITLNEAFAYAVPLVERLRSRAGPQTPHIMAPEPLGALVLTRAQAATASAAPAPAENLNCGARSLTVGKRDQRCTQ